MAFIAKNSTIVTHYRNIEKIVCIGSGKQHFFFSKPKSGMMLNTWWVIFASNFTKKGGLAPLLICCLLLCVLKHGQGIINPFCSRRQASHSKKWVYCCWFFKKHYHFYFTWLCSSSIIVRLISKSIFYQLDGNLAVRRYSK